MAGQRDDRGKDQSIEDWLAKKLAFDLDDEEDLDDSDPTAPEVVEPTVPALPALPDDLGGRSGDEAPTQQSPFEATFASDGEATRVSGGEPSIPIPWPDWEPEPFPAFDDGRHAEPSVPIPSRPIGTLAPPPWEDDTDPEPTVDLLGAGPQIAAGPSPLAPLFGGSPELPRWGDNDEPEETSTLLRDDTPPEAPPRRVTPPPARGNTPRSVEVPPEPPPPSPTPPAAPVRQLAAAPSALNRSRTPLSSPPRRRRGRGRPNAPTEVGRTAPVADPRPSTRPRRRDIGAPVATTWEEDPNLPTFEEEDPELSYAGVDVPLPSDLAEPELEDLEAPVQEGSYDEVFPPPRAGHSISEWGSPVRTLGGTPRDPPTLREDHESGGVRTAPRPPPSHASEERTAIRGFASPGSPDEFLFDDQPTVIIKPSSNPFPDLPPAPPPRSEPDINPYQTTLLAWTGASVGVVLFIVMFAAAVLVVQYLGLLTP